MIKKVLTTMILLIMFNGCVGTMKVAEEDAIQASQHAPMQAKVSEEHNSSH